MKRLYMISYEDRFGRYAFGVTTDPDGWKQLMMETKASGEDEKKLRRRLREATFQELVAS